VSYQDPRGKLSSAKLTPWHCRGKEGRTGLGPQKNMAVGLSASVSLAARDLS
jgi:hypothetical protein